MSEVVLPEGWIKTELKDFVFNANGARKPISAELREQIKGSFPYYGATGQIDSLNDYTHEGEHILIGEDGANLLSKSKDLAFVVNGKYWVNNHAHAVRPLAGVPSKYIANFINSLDLTSFVTGSAQPKLTKGNLEKIEIPVPPLAEQKIIAAKLDELLAQVDIIKARLTTIPKMLKRFRQSVLAAAVSGKLTDIINERAFISLGNAGVTIKTGPFGSALHKADYVQDGIPVINPMHINDGKIYPSGSMTITKEKFAELSAWHLKHGDVIIGRRGEMGRAAVFDKSQKDMLCGTGSMILRGDESVLPDYLSIIVRSPVAVAYFNDGSVGTTMVNLNQSIIKELKVYFPEIEEQTEIVRRVEQLFAFADQIEQQVKNAHSRVNNLTQSILAKAFRGELTADWRAANPDLITGENSAQALLAKIKAEREKPKKTTKQQAMFNE